MYNKQKIKNGISLIVLVIVIVVMIILSSAIILMVNDATIVKNANRAVKESDIAKAKEVVMMAKTDWRTNERQISKDGYTTFKNYAESRLSEVGFKIGNNGGEFEISDSGLLYEYKVPVVPKGFVASSLETENEVSEGFVIYEGNEPVTHKNAKIAQETRNQFVWIPVPNMTEFKLTDGYSNGISQNHVDIEEVSEPCLPSILSLTSVDFKTGEYAEYNEMRSSIEKYGGFYIARYETGTTNARTNKANKTSYNIDVIKADVLIQKGKPVYNYVGWGPSMSNVDGDVIDITNSKNLNQGLGAVILSRGLYLNSDAVSHLIYGVQWDSVIRFINDNTAKINSSMSGNYTNYNKSVETDKKIDGAGSLKTTGASETWMFKNIYDLAGNVAEWTMEAFHGAQIGRTIRGGAANYTGNDKPASNRFTNVTCHTEELLGFRVALYIK